jgi:hypothetical protein
VSWATEQSLQGVLAHWAIESRVHALEMCDLAVTFLKLILDVRPCMHLHASSYMQRMSHNRLRKVCVLDTDTMAVRSLDEVFQNEVPAAVFRGSNTGNLGARRPSCTYGTIVVGQRQIGGISGGVVLYRHSQTEFAAMMDF